MSYTAINSVTLGLRMLLYSQLVRMSSGAVVTLLPPGDSLPEVSGVNLYLYRVIESPYTRNQPWAGDKTTPASNRTPLGLQLFYLLTPLGQPPSDSSVTEGDDAHTMLGIAMSTLHENPILNEIHLPALPASGSLNATPGFDADGVFPADILNSYEQLKVMLLPTSIDELSKIWATINQPYRLSVAYEVSLVEIVPTVPSPVSGAIVTSIGLTVYTLGPPTIADLKPARGALAFLNATGVVQANLLEMDGAQLSAGGNTATVTVGGQAATLQPTSPPSTGSLVLVLPTDLSAGPAASVVATLNGKASVAVPFEVTPWLSRITPQRTPLPGSQKLTLAGVGFTATPAGVLFDGVGAPTGAVPFDGGVTDAQGTLTIPAALENGLYMIRIVLSDAAKSVSNSQTLEIVPFVNTATLTAGSPPAATLTVTGARLNGTDIRIVIDGETYQAAPNSNAAILTYQFAQPLSPGSHSLSVAVDGHTSHTVDLEA